MLYNEGILALKINALRCLLLYYLLYFMNIYTILPNIINYYFIKLIYFTDYQYIMCTYHNTLLR